MPFRLAQFQSLARQTEPESAALVHCRHRNDPQRELYAIVSLTRLKPAQFPQYEYLMVQAEPLLLCQRDSGRAEQLRTTAGDFDDYNQFALLIDHSCGKCKFGPGSFLGLERNLQGFGLGSYMLSRLIRYGQEHYPKFAVSPEHLDTRDSGFDPSCIEGFCQQFNLEVVFRSEKELTCLVKRMELLHTSDASGRVREVEAELPSELVFPSVERDQIIRRISCCT